MVWQVVIAIVATLAVAEYFNRRIDAIRREQIAELRAQRDRRERR